MVPTTLLQATSQVAQKSTFQYLIYLQITFIPTGWLRIFTHIPKTYLTNPRTSSQICIGGPFVQLSAFFFFFLYVCVESAKMGKKTNFFLTESYEKLYMLLVLSTFHFAGLKSCILILCHLSEFNLKFIRTREHVISCMVNATGTICTNENINLTCPKHRYSCYVLAK